MQCLDCKENGFTFPLVKMECPCRDLTKCMDCGYKYEIVPTRCETCRGLGFHKPKSNESKD